MNYAAITEEIHRKLNVLGLSQDPRMDYGIMRLQSHGPVTNTMFSRMGKHYNLTWTIDYTTKRFMIVGWLLLGGKLRVRRI